MKQFPILLILLLSIACKPLQLAEVQPQALHINPELSESDSLIEGMIAPYRAKMEEEMNQVIGKVPVMLLKEQPEGTLNNWVGDLLQDRGKKYCQTPPDFSIANYGGLRIPSIAEGDFTRGTAFELMPFDNLLVLVEAKGPEIQQLLNVMAAKGGWAQSKELRFQLKDGKASNISIGGKPFDINATYHFLITDYVANGGDSCSFLKELPRENTGVLFRDAILEFVVDKGTVEAVLDGRAFF